MREPTVVRRYAAALLRVAEAEGFTDEAEHLLRGLGEVYAQDPSFRSFLAHPRLPRAAKKDFLQQILGGRPRPPFLRFLNLLVDKRRWSLLPDLAEAFGHLADAARGRARVRLRSWRPIPERLLRELESRLQRITGSRVEIREETDPSLRGGVCLFIGNTVIDGSVSRRLKTLRERLQELQQVLNPA